MRGPAGSTHDKTSWFDIDDGISKFKMIRFDACKLIWITQFKKKKKFVDPASYISGLGRVDDLFPHAAKIRTNS